MKIIICTPLFVRQKSLDYAYWNVVVPLGKMGHNVSVYDYTTHIEFKDWLAGYSKTGDPDLIISFATGHEGDSFYETFNHLLKSEIQTANWFCDDSWRYDNFSKKVYSNFKHAITTERSFLEKYEGVNVHYSTWPVDGDLFKFHHKSSKTEMFCSYGGINDHRVELLQNASNVSKVVMPKTNFYEDVVGTLSSSRICICSSENRGTRQTKARVFEAAAAGCLIVTEEYPDMDHHFTKQEMITFSGPETIEQVMKKILEVPSFIEYVASRSLQRFNAEYEAKIVLQKLLDNIKAE